MCFLCMYVDGVRLYLFGLSFNCNMLSPYELSLTSKPQIVELKLRWKKNRFLWARKCSQLTLTLQGLLQRNTCWFLYFLSGKLTICFVIYDCNNCKLQYQRRYSRNEVTWICYHPLLFCRYFVEIANVDVVL